MKNFFLIAGLLAFLLLVLFTTRFGAHSSTEASPMNGDGMMNGNGMMDGGGMMNREQMRNFMQQMMPEMLPPGVKPQDLPDPNSPGARLMDRYCAQCHNLPSPAMHTAREWPPVMDRMMRRMSMMSGRGGMGMMYIETPSPEEQQTILSYLEAHSLKAVAPGALPSPESPGAALFKSKCSQCHALPDPEIHSPQEWGPVIDRMQAHMQTMGKKPVTKQEKAEILDYLSRASKTR